MTKFSIEPFLFTDNPKLQINIKNIDDLLSERASQLYEPHKISFYALHLFKSGEGFHTTDFNTFKVKDKHILFLSKNQINKFHIPVNYDAEVLIFTEEFFCINQMHYKFLYNTCLFNDPTQLTYFNINNRYEEILLLLNLIKKELQNKNSKNQHILLNNYLFSLLLICENESKLTRPIHVKVLPQKMLVSNFKSFVNENLNKSLSVKDIASILNINVRTLEKTFKETEGHTPYHWINSRILLEAKRLLIYKTMNINEISYTLGFNEPAHFTKFFRSQTNLTPSQFRELHKF